MQLGTPMKLLSTCALALAGALPGCMTFGLLYEDVGHPPMDLEVSVSAKAVSMMRAWDPNLNASMGGRALVKRGVACSQDVLKLVAWGDATQAAAAKEGGITEVVGMDVDNTAILGFVYTQNCTVVYGRGEEQAPPASPAAPSPTAAPEPAPAPAPSPVPAPVAPPPVPPPAPMVPGSAPPIAPAPPPPPPT